MNSYRTGGAASASASTPSLNDGASEPNAPALVTLESAILKDVAVQLSARLGDVTLPLSELLALKAGSVVTLGASLNDLIELKLGESVVARGEIVAVDDHFGIRLVEVAAP